METRFKGTDNNPYLVLCQRGHLDCLKKLNEILQTSSSSELCHHPCRFTVDEKGNSALHLASTTQNVQLMKYLLENVYFPNNDKNNNNGLKVIYHRNTSGQTPIVFACKNQSKNGIKMFKLLLEYTPHKMNPIEQHTWFPIQAAAF